MGCLFFWGYELSGEYVEIERVFYGYCIYILYCMYGYYIIYKFVSVHL